MMIALLKAIVALANAVTWTSTSAWVALALFFTAVATTIAAWKASLAACGTCPTADPTVLLPIRIVALSMAVFNAV